MKRLLTLLILTSCCLAAPHAAASPRLSPVCHMKLKHVEQRQGYRVERVEVPVSQHQVAQGYLLIPDHIPAHGCPAILACHDHGARFTIGKEKLCFPIEADAEKRAEAETWVNKYYHGAFVADTLASRGYVVLVIDALYWGSRCTHPDWSNKQLKEAQPEFYEQYLQMTGMPWFEKILADDKACITYLRHRREVNARHIGVWGFSMGAYRAWQLAAEDRRVRFCAAANWMTTLIERGGQLPDVSGYSMFRPTKEYSEYGQIAARIAPRPFLLQYGTQDHLFPEEAVQEAVAYIREKRRNRLTLSAIPSEHRFTKQHLQELLKWLKENI